MTISVAGLQERFDDELEKGYRGARVDPNPNSAYSQETDPMTSPRAPRHGSNFLHIDEFADPASPDIANIHGRAGLDEDDLAAAQTQTITEDISADASAGTGQTTVLDGEPEFDGAVSAATFKPVATITGHADNNRTFTLKNVTRNETLATITTVATKSAGVAVAMTLDSTPIVSEGDELSVVETVAGTGVAHGGAEIVITVTQAE